MMADRRVGSVQFLFSDIAESIDIFEELLSKNRTSRVY